MECQLCLKLYACHSDIKRDFLICKTKSCKNINLIGECENGNDCYFIHNGSSYIRGQIYLKVNISMLLFVPDLFENSLDGNTLEIHRSFSNFHKQFDSIDVFRNCVDFYRSKIAFCNKKENYFFKNYFDNMILKLGISKNFQLSYTSSFLCSHCKFSFNKSLSANYLLESLVLSCPVFSTNQMEYEIKCGKCLNKGVITFNFENKPKFLVLFMKEGFIHSMNTDMKNCLKNNILILETDEPLNKKFSLWIKSDKLWYNQNNVSDKLLQSSEIPVINSQNVRVMFYKFDRNLSLKDNSNSTNSEDSKDSNKKCVKKKFDIDDLIEAKKRKLSEKFFIK